MQKSSPNIEVEDKESIWEREFEEPLTATDEVEDSDVTQKMKDIPIHEDVPFSYPSRPNDEDSLVSHFERLNTRFDPMEM